MTPEEAKVTYDMKGEEISQFIHKVGCPRCQSTKTYPDSKPILYSGVYASPSELYPNLQLYCENCRNYFIHEVRLDEDDS